MSARNRVEECLKSIMGAVRAPHFAAIKSEAEVRERYIGRLLHSLGWDVYGETGVDEVRYEFPIEYEGKTGRVDYALFSKGKGRDTAPAVLVEAKRPDSLGSAAGSQAFEYARNHGGDHMRMVVATNGRIWRFFDVLARGKSADERLAHEIDLADISPSKARQDLMALLHKPQVAAGKHEGVLRIFRDLKMQLTQAELGADIGSDAAADAPRGGQAPSECLATCEQPPHAGLPLDRLLVACVLKRSGLVDASHTSLRQGFIALFKWLYAEKGDAGLLAIQDASKATLVSNEPIDRRSVPIGRKHLMANFSKDQILRHATFAAATLGYAWGKDVELVVC